MLANPINPTQGPQSDPKAASHAGKASKKQQPPSPGMDPLLFVYMCMFSAMETTQKTANIQAKGLSLNAQAQNIMIDQEAQITFQTIRWSLMFTQKDGKVVTKKVGQSILAGVQAHNTQVSAIRGVMENQISLERQGAQINETNLNSNVNQNQQTQQQGASLMQMLVTLTQQIER